MHACIHIQYSYTYTHTYTQACKHIHHHTYRSAHPCTHIHTQAIYYKNLFYNKKQKLEEMNLIPVVKNKQKRKILLIMVNL